MKIRNAISTLIWVNLCLFIGALYLVFIFVPTESTMGAVQRIFYFHVPIAWVAFLAFFVVFLSSVMYLRKQDKKWDILANSSAEVGFIFTTLVLITGSIWAKPIWGVWWTWEPRLTTSLVLWLIYIAYMIVRVYAKGKQQGAKFAAIVGIVGFVDVPIVALAITLWRTQHPGPLIFQGGLMPSMLITLLVSLVAFTMIYFLILILRVSMETDKTKLESLISQD